MRRTFRPEQRNVLLFYCKILALHFPRITRSVFSIDDCPRKLYPTHYKYCIRNDVTINLIYLNRSLNHLWNSTWSKKDMVWIWKNWSLPFLDPCCYIIGSSSFLHTLFLLRLLDDTSPWRNYAISFNSTLPSHAKLIKLWIITIANDKTF